MAKYIKITIVITAVMLSLVFVSAMMADNVYSDPFNAHKTGGLAYVPDTSIIPNSVYNINASSQNLGQVNLGFGDPFGALNSMIADTANASGLLQGFLNSMRLPTTFIAIFAALCALLLALAAIEILGGRRVED